jgi:hypothetical protein
VFLPQDRKLAAGQILDGEMGYRVSGAVYHVYAKGAVGAIRDHYAILAGLWPGKKHISWLCSNALSTGYVILSLIPDENYN